MGEGRERVPAAVILIIFLIGAIVIYLVTIPQPVAYSLVFGNFSNSHSGTNSTSSAQHGSYYDQLTAYIGGNPSTVNTTYSIGTFSASYNEYNSTVGGANTFTLTSSIFGSSSYNMGFNGSSADTYFLAINITSVSGTPKLRLSLNGNYFYTVIPAGNEQILLQLPAAINGKNTLSIYNNLNGFAFTQAISFSEVAITQMAGDNASHYGTVTALTLSGLGNYYLTYTPIGYGNLTISANGYDLTKLSAASDTPTTIMLPSDVVNKAIGSGASAILPATFNLGFVVSQSSTYEIANAGLVYEMPYVAPNTISVPYSVKGTSGEYVMTFYVDSIMEPGSVSFTFYPSGQSYQISAANLVAGENIIILPNSALSVTQLDGNYTGTMSISSTGLVIPQYVQIKPTS